MPNAEAALTTARLYTHPMRRLPALALVPLLAACSLISLDLTPRIEPLREQTVEGRGRAKILLLDISGFLSDEGGPPSLVIGGPTPPRAPLLVRVREERTIFQSVIDSLYGQFVEKLAESRRLGLETARKVADGRIYTAQQALDLKLIDRIGYMPDAIEAAKRVIGVEEARIVVYRRPREYRATYYARSEAPAAAVESSLARLGAALGAGPRFLYFWWP